MTGRHGPTMTNIAKYVARRFADVASIADLADLLPPPGETDAVADNDIRALRGAVAVVAYAKQIYPRGRRRAPVTDFESIVEDLLADLAHFCDAAGLDFNLLEVRAEEHHRQETTAGGDNSA
jgi:hypothetical protein